MKAPTPRMPAGFTPDMLAAITQYLAAQNAALKASKRPSGTLKSSQVRGVDTDYQYQFEEFPKALWPPRIVVANEMEERSFRVRDKQPLPWSDTPMITAYYAHRQYPVEMQPLQVVVNSLDEERYQLAEWNITDPARVSYPRWLFHASRPPQLVNTPEQESTLGKGWHSTIQEATDEARALADEEPPHGRRVPPTGHKVKQEKVDA